MLSSLKRLVGNISVEEKGDLITIEGLPNISTRSAEIMKWSKDQVEAIMGRKIGGDVEMALENFEEEFDTQISMEGQRLSDVPPAWVGW